MLFNSIVFWLFFILVLGCYGLLKHGSQNKLLLLASYIFYGAWDWRFLLLLILSTGIDYFCAKLIAGTADPRKRRIGLMVSVGVGFGILGFFKYFNFFADSFAGLLTIAGFRPDIVTLNIVLPVGISFYTFQTMSYVIDVYRKKLEPAKNLIDFALYVSFFPQLVAGPIERAEHLLPQIQNPRRMSKGKFLEGLHLSFWGLFKKVVIADNMAQIADYVFMPGQVLPGWVTLIGIYAFAFQIYGDFSGYSDIARGTAKMMGFELMVNFRQPYLAANPSDFWKRWHISLSTWLRDYLYIPLGGSRHGTWQTYRNLAITMLLGGLWHGASWMFVVWGGYHALLLILYHAYQSAVRTSPPGFWASRAMHAVKVCLTFHLVCLGWIFFRAHTWPQAAAIFSQIAHFQFAGLSSLIFYSPLSIGLTVFALLALWFAVQNYREYGGLPRLGFHNMPIGLKIPAYTILIGFYFLTSVTHAKQFIYFQF